MTSVTPGGKLDLGRIIGEAFALPWRRRAAFVKALAVPAIAIVAMQVGWGLAEGKVSTAVGWAAGAAYGMLWILFAVACHRVVLLELRHADIPAVPGWGRRETVFLASFLFICLSTFLAASLAVVTVGTVVVNLTSVSFFESFFEKLMYLAGTYVFARLALLLPAAAIDAWLTPGKAWRRTRGNGWRMVVVVGVLPWTLHYAADFAGGEDPGMVWGTVVAALATILLVVEIAALSLSYRALTHHE